jgi:predicted dehydrogenase
MKKHPTPNAPAANAQLSRRGFLATSAAVLGTAALSRPFTLLGAPAASTTANSKLNLALVGCGGQGRHDMLQMIDDANVVALCDPDSTAIDAARADAVKRVPGAKDAEGYEDYRKLLDKADSFDAVIIGTPDHWHVPLATAFMKAGKHVYCEKPLAHSIAEARGLRELSRTSKVVTQMGNQGSASESCRRSIEIIKAGALGQIREVYQWGIGAAAKEGNAEGEDPIPDGFNWDLWVGPSAMRPYKKGTYHPFKWRGWYDFGNGGLADFCCHDINLPMRALDLSYPERIVLNLENGKQAAGKPALEFHFAPRGKLLPLTLYWQGSGRPPTEVIQPLIDRNKDTVPGGIMIMGEKGVIYTSHWATGGLIRLAGEEKLRDVLHHEGTKEIGQTLPRVKNHYVEFLAACRGEGKTFSPFEVGGLLTEIGLSGAVAIRTGKSLEWDGENMQATNAPEAAKFIRTEHRAKWLS